MWYQWRLEGVKSKAQGPEQGTVTYFTMLERSSSPVGLYPAPTPELAAAETIGLSASRAPDQEGDGCPAMPFCPAATSQTSPTLVCPGVASIPRTVLRQE